MLSNNKSALSIDGPCALATPLTRPMAYFQPPAPPEPLIHCTPCFSGTDAHNSQSDSKLRVMPSAKTSPDYSSSSSSAADSSSSAADKAQAAANALTNISPQQTNFPQSYAAPPIHVAFPPVFRGFGYKLPMTINFPKPPSHLQQVQLPIHTDDEEEEEEREMDDVKGEEHAVAGVSSQRGSNHRVKRGGYNAPYFVGKRSLEESEELDQEELQKRDVGSDDMDDELPELQSQTEDLELERRVSPMFVGKRRVPMFVGKRKMAPLFVGKRRAPYFVGKRRVPMFVGRRDPPMFVGRAVPMFVGRAAPMFVGKRQAPMFVGKRAVPMFVGKRLSPMFVGKRPSPMFVGKRPSPMFVGKRPSPMFVGKRPSPMFVGKRDEEGLNELLAALHTLQAARHYRRMIQADKRHNAPFFVGRRSSPLLDESIEEAPEVKDDYFR